MGVNRPIHGIYYMLGKLTRDKKERGPMWEVLVKEVDSLYRPHKIVHKTPAAKVSRIRTRPLERRIGSLVKAYKDGALEQEDFKNLLLKLVT